MTRRRGFCALGHDGYSIDLSKGDCQDWIYSSYNQETTDLERKIDDFNYKMLRSCDDRRSKQYRAMKEYFETLSESKKDESNYHRWSIFHYFTEQYMADAYTRAILADDILELKCHRKHMAMKDYNKMMFTIRQEIFEKIEPLLEDKPPTITIVEPDQ